MPRPACFVNFDCLSVVRVARWNVTDRDFVIFANGCRRYPGQQRDAEDEDADDGGPTCGSSIHPEPPSLFPTSRLNQERFVINEHTTRAARYRSARASAARAAARSASHHA
jgi:hypothetical protein